MFDSSFLTNAANILGDTNKGLSGNDIVKYCTQYASDHNIRDLPHSKVPLENVNKRTALADNLNKFQDEPKVLFMLLDKLCSLEQFKDNKEVKKLKCKLHTEYGKFSSSEINLEPKLIEDTIHWLKEYPDVLKIYRDALEKHKINLYERNVLDDMRLALEKLICSILGNSRTLEKNINELGGYLKNREVHQEFMNMYTKLIDYFCKYQNDNVKHNSNVASEVEFIIELASSFMKFLVKIVSIESPYTNV